MKKSTLFLTLIISLFITACGQKESTGKIINDVNNSTSIEYKENEVIKETEIIENEKSLEKVEEVQEVIEESEFVEDNLIEDFETQTFYGKIIDIVDNQILIYFNLGMCYLTTPDSINEFDVGNYISFESDGIMLLSYPAQMSVENVQISDINAYMESFSSVPNENFAKPYTNGDLPGLAYESEIIDIVEKKENSSSYLCNTYDGLIYFSMDYPTDYNIGDFVEFYTDGMVLDSYPAQINGVIDSALIVVN